MNLLKRKDAPNFTGDVAVIPKPTADISTKDSMEMTAIESDRLQVPIVFLAAEKNKRIKIPGTKRGDTVLPIPLYAQFVDHRYTCKSRYIASIIKSHCSVQGVLELKG